jgi:Asp/Glu/hydantoin racemase
MKLLVVNPNTSADITGVIGASARRAAAAETEIVLTGGSFGPRYIATRSESAIAAHATLTALAAHLPGCDAAVVAAFTDPGLFAARELAPAPVVGMAEAAMLTACMLGSRFAVLTISRRLIPVIRELADAYGLGARLAGVRAVEQSAIDVARAPEAAVDGFAAAGRAALDEDGADVLVLGGAPLAPLDRPLRDRLGVPVLDGIGCAVRQAEVLARMGLVKPRAGSYAPPPAKELVGVTPALARLFQEKA